MKPQGTKHVEINGSKHMSIQGKLLARDSDNRVDLQQFMSLII
jgi:hypothetical protein